MEETIHPQYSSAFCSFCMINPYDVATIGLNRDPIRSLRCGFILYGGESTTRSMDVFPSSKFNEITPPNWITLLAISSRSFLRNMHVPYDDGYVSIVIRLDVTLYSVVWAAIPQGFKHSRDL